MEIPGTRGGLKSVLRFCSLAFVAVAASLFFAQNTGPEVKPAGAVKNECQVVRTAPAVEPADPLPAEPAGSSPAGASFTHERLTATVAVKTASPAPALPSRGDRPETQKAIEGLASWYGGDDGLDGSRTSSGEIFDAAALTGAHRTLPYGTRVRVTLLRTGRSVVVRINDRGPFVAGRIIDLSRAAAEAIGLIDYGVGMVRLEVVE